jgi:hypothetical protein
MKKPKMFIPPSHRLRGAPEVSSAGEKAPPPLSYKHMDLFIKFMILRGHARRMSHRNAGSME